MTSFLRGLVCAAILTFTAPIWAQDITGTVQGTIVDGTGARVPSAQVELVNEGTQIRLTRTSNDQGDYQFNLVPPGLYTVSASSTGFKTVSVKGIDVAINKSTRVDLTLQVGTIAESVEVSASAVRIDTSSAQVSTNINTKMIIDLPSGSRNALSYAEMAPGVSIVNGASQVQNITGTAANVNGNRQARNVFYLDGSDNTGPFRNTALQFPNPEAVQEVNVTTSNTSAEFGKQPGGVFNVITRSGTNQFHGSAFLFLHNEAFNANTYARNLSGQPRAVDRLRQFGGTLGGPVIHNKTFFFASYMRYRDQASGFQNTIKFPTQAMVNGNFSQFPQQLYDPDTHQPLAGNIVPARLIDPVAQNILKLIPTVANYGDRYIWSFTDPQINNEVLGKIDHTFNSAHSLQASYFHTFGDQLISNTAAAGNVPAWGPQVNASQQHTGIARHIWVIRPNLLLESKFATSRLYADRGNANIGRNLSDFGAKYPTVQEGARKYLPIIRISDGLQAQQGFLSRFDQGNTRFGTALSWIKNKHSFKFGYESQRDNVMQVNDQDSLNLLFDGRASSTDPTGKQVGVGVFGYSFADFLMGRVATFTLAGILNYDIHTWSHFFFAQDEWKITPRLTITPGLRYEFYQPATEANNRAVSFINGFRSTLFPNAPIGTAFAGDPGIPNGFTKNDYNNFAPRLGVAYDIRGNGREVIRAGAGYYYSYNPLQVRLWSVEAAPWRPNASGGDTTGLTDIFGTSRSVVFNKPPTPFTTDVTNFQYPPRVNNLIGFDNNFVTPYSFQYNLTFEKQISNHLSASAGYVGNRGFHNLQILPGNLPLPSPTATLNNIDARRPLSAYSNIGIVYSRARSWYDSLQLTADIRSLKGLTTRFTYVYGKLFDVATEDPTGNSNLQTSNPLNWDSDRALDNNLHQFRAFYIYDLPRLVNFRPLVRTTLGGWQLSGTTTITSGDPLNVVVGSDYNFDSVSGDRPDYTKPITYTNGSRDQRMARYFDTTAFANPASRTTFGTLPRNALWGPGTWGSNLALLKKIQVNERMFLQLRGEAFNVFNHSNLNNPNLTLSSSDFGRILSRSGSRVVQLGARFQF